MSLLAHVAGLPVEELLVPSLAYGATGLAVAARIALRRLGDRRDR